MKLHDSLKERGVPDAFLWMEKENLGTIIPIQKDSKKPMIPWKPYQEGKNIPESLEERRRTLLNQGQCNYAILLHEEPENDVRVVALDIDQHDEEDREPAERLIQALQGKTTLQVRTQGGGLHVYMLIPAEADIPTQKAVRELPIEVKASGYLLIPPSTIQGREYKLGKVAPPIEIQGPLHPFIEALLKDAGYKPEDHCPWKQEEKRKKEEQVRQTGQWRTTRPDNDEGWMEALNYPCIATTIEKAQEDKHLEHQQRLHIANFLVRAVMNGEISMNEAVNFYGFCSDFNKEVTREQLDYTWRKIEAERLKPPKCQSLIEEFKWDERGCEGCSRKIRPGVIEDAGYNTKEGKKKPQSTPEQEELLDMTEDKKEQIIQILKENKREGTRQELSLYTVGALYKAGHQKEVVEEIITRAFPEEKEQETTTIQTTYQKDPEEVKGFAGLEEILPPKDYRRLKELIGTTTHMRIVRLLQMDKEPSGKTLARYLFNEVRLAQHPQTRTYYIQGDDGVYYPIPNGEEIPMLMTLLRERFGDYEISTSRVEKALEYVNVYLEKDYDLVLFKNGVLNMRTREFTPDKTILGENIPYRYVEWMDWNPEAHPGHNPIDDEGEIGRLIRRTFKGREDDLKYFLTFLGSCFDSNNTLQKALIIQGPERTGKSTLGAIFYRLFRVSAVKVPELTGTDGFRLYPLIYSEVNIDDDLGKADIEQAGLLKSIISSEPIEIPEKYSRNPVRLESREVPRIVIFGNYLPNITDMEGMARRILLLRAINKIPREELKEDLSILIREGEYDDKGMQWLVHEAITTYWENDRKITSRETEERMVEEYRRLADPVYAVVEELFEFSFEDDDYIPVRVVNNLVMRYWKEEVVKKMNIKKPIRANDVARAMRVAGYDRMYKKIRDDLASEEARDDVYRSTKCYVYITYTEKAREFLKEKGAMLDHFP